MDRKGGTVFLLLVCYTVLATSEEKYEKSKISRQLMRKCIEAEYKRPDITQLLTVLGSDATAVERNSDSPNAMFLSIFAIILSHVTDDIPQTDLFDFLKKKDKDFEDFDLTALPGMIQKFKNVKEAMKCFVFAVLAPVAWKVVTNSKNANMDLEKFELLLLPAEKIMENPPRGRFQGLSFPKNLSIPNMQALMKLMRKNYAFMVEHKAEVAKHLIVHFEQEHLKCTSTTDSDKCGRWDKNTTREAVQMLGPFIFSLTADVIGRLSEEGLCELLNLFDQFDLILDIRKIHPSSIITLNKKLNSCPEFSRHSDRWDLLVCVAEISQCRGQMLLIREVVELSFKNVMDRIKDPNVKYRGKAMRALVQMALRFFGVTMCQKLSDEQLKKLQPVAEYIPVCILRKASCDSEVLRSKFQKLSNPQAVAVAKGQCGHLSVTRLMDFFSEKVLYFLRNEDLKKTKITSWVKIRKMGWLPGQTIILLEMRCRDVKKCYRNLGSLTPAYNCYLIKTAEDKDVWEMCQGLTDFSHLLSKSQVICLANRLFAFLESQRSNYFKTITPRELNRIPTILLIHLPPETIMDLPDIVCKDFLNKMKMANLSTLSLSSTSRSALKDRALKCLGTDLSSVSSEAMGRLGPLLCEVPPQQLKLLKPEVLRECLLTMGICGNSIPEQHKKGLDELLINTFRDPRTWSETVMEVLFPLLILDENIWSRLPDQPWMIRVLHFHAPQIQGPAKDVVKKGLFALIVSLNESESSSTVSRGKRAANENSNDQKKLDGGSSNSINTNISNSIVPNVVRIQQLGDANDQWTSQHLKNMNLSTFIEMAEILGDMTSLSREQLKELCEKAEEAWGDAQSMNESVVSQLGCIAQGFPNDKLKMMAFSQSSLEDIAKCGWTNTQVSSVWKGVAKYNSLSAESLDTSDMMEMGPFICGLNSTEIQQLNSTAFKHAVNFIHEVVCPIEVTQHFRPIVLDGFGEPSTWSIDKIVSLDHLIAILNASEFASFETKVFSHFTPKTIQFLTAAHFSKLSVEQLKALDSETAATVTSAQKADMSKEQLNALTQASRGQTLSGTSSKAAEGLGTFTKLFVFFVVVLLLL